MSARPEAALVIGLGNPLMGDEGIGWHVVERLRSGNRLPAGADALWGGTDLLRFAARMKAARRVIVVDALLGGGPPGQVEFLDGGLDEFDLRQGHVHALSAIQAIAILRRVAPEFALVRFTLALIAIPQAAAGLELSAALAAAAPAIVNRIIAELRREPGAEPL